MLLHFRLKSHLGTNVSKALLPTCAIDIPIELVLTITVLVALDDPGLCVFDYIGLLAIHIRII